MRYNNLFYGSLRKGEYNHKAFVRMFGEENFLYKGTKTIKGFALYSLGAYPVIIPNSDSEVIVDEFELSEDAHKSVKMMELGAGYYEQLIDDKHIYVMDSPPSYHSGLVKHGDWSKHLRENGIY